MKVSSIVTPVEPLSLNDTISTALSLMHSRNVDIVPISDPQKGLVGAVTRMDLLSALQSGMPLTGTLEDRLSGLTASLSPDEEVEGIPRTDFFDHEFRRWNKYDKVKDPVFNKCISPESDDEKHLPNQ